MATITETSEETAVTDLSLGQGQLLGPFGTPALISFTAEDIRTVTEMQDAEEEPMLLLDAA